MLGITQLQKEWRAIGELYEPRYQHAISQSGTPLALADLERVVKASMAYERDLQTAIARLRSVDPRLIDTPKETDQLIAFEQELKTRILARIENYPDLKNNEVMQQFMDIMARTEDYLSLLRNSYSDSATIYNTRIQSFPDVILAGLFRFRSCDYFQAADGTQLCAPQ